MDEEGFDKAAWIAKSRQQLMKFFRSGSRKSGKLMVDIVINAEKFQFDFFYIDADEKYSAVG